MPPTARHVSNRNQSDMKSPFSLILACVQVRRTSEVGFGKK